MVSDHEEDNFVCFSESPNFNKIEETFNTALMALFVKKQKGTRLI